MIPRTQGRLGRTATLAILPLMAVAIYIALNAGSDEVAPGVTFEPEGVLVIADLAGESLVIHAAGQGAAPSTLALPGPPHELAVIDGRVYVTLGRADMVVEVDPYAPGILRTLDLPGRPHAIAANAEGDLLVGLDDRGAIAVIERERFSVSGTIPAGDTPHMLAVQQDTIFATDSRDNSVRAIRANDQRTAPAGSVPEAIAVAAGTVAVGSVESDTLAFFDAATLQPRAEWSLPGHPVRIAPVNETHFAVSLKQAGEVVFVDIAAAEEVARVEAGAFPDGLCQSPSGDYLGVAANGDGALIVVAVDGWEPLGSIYAGTAPGACRWLPN